MKLKVEFIVKTVLNKILAKIKMMTNAKICPDIYHAFSKFLNSKEEKSSLPVEYNSDEFSVMFLKLESGNIRIRTDKWLQMTQIQNDLAKQDIKYAGPLLITDSIDFTPEQAEKVVETIR